MQVMPPEAPQPGGVFRKVVSFTRCAGRLKKQFFFWGGCASPHVLDRFIQTEERVYIFLVPGGSENPFLFPVEVTFDTGWACRPRGGLWGSGVREIWVTLGALRTIPILGPVPFHHRHL